jgi:predicted transcriptional regulator YdeE
MTGSPCLERPGPFSLIGLLGAHNREQETYDMVQGIGRQWTDYMIRRVAPPWSPEAWRYGVMLRMADGDTALSYFCGAPPPEPPETPAGFVALTVPALTWAVFPFDGHVTQFRSFLHTVFGTELAKNGLKPVPGGPEVPEFIERYDWRFDPAAGKGGIELMVPVVD